MPLSEHEQRQLEQIEQALYAEYPRFASAVRSADPRVHYQRRVVYGVLTFLLGIALLLAGVSIPYIPVSIGGFIVMLASSMWIVSSYRRKMGIATGRTAAKDRRGRGRDARPAKRPAKRSGFGFTDRLEERWRRRQEGGS